MTYPTDPSPKALNPATNAPLGSPAAIGAVAGRVLAALEAGHLTEEGAEGLIGAMVLNAARPVPAGDAWRTGLLRVGVSSDVVDAAQADLRSLTRAPGAVVGRQGSVAAHQTDDVARFMQYLRVLGQPHEWDAATTYDGVALAIIDSVWSIGVRYQGVLNVVARYRAARHAEGAQPDADTPADLAAYIRDRGGPEAFAEIVNNRQRTSARNGILKAEAVFLQAQMLAEESIDSPSDLAGAETTRLADLRRCWTAVPGQASGLSWDYLLMLCGLQGVKADRMVRRFVAAALGHRDEHAVPAHHARDLVMVAAERLNVDASQLDYAIWRHESGQ